MINHHKANCLFTSSTYPGIVSYDLRINKFLNLSSAVYALQRELIHN